MTVEVGDMPANHYTSLNPQGLSSPRLWPHPDVNNAQQGLTSRKSYLHKKPHANYSIWYLFFHKQDSSKGLLFSSFPKA